MSGEEHPRETASVEATTTLTAGGYLPELRYQPLAFVKPCVETFSPWPAHASAGERTSAAVRATLDAARTYAVGVGPSKGSVDRELVDAAHARCLVVHPYTVNEKAEMRSLVDLGMDGMFTNFPDRLDQVLGRRAVGGTRGAELAARASKDCRESATTAARVRLPST